MNKKIITTKKQTSSVSGSRYSADYQGTRKYQVFPKETRLNDAERHMATAQALADVVFGPGRTLEGGKVREGEDYFAWFLD